MSLERNAASPLEIWLHSLRPSRRQRARRWWEFCESTGHLQSRWPNQQQPLVSAWLGNRWYFFPDPLPAGPTVAIGSSRWGRRPEDWIPLAERLHVTLTDLSPLDDVLMTSADTTCDRLIRRWAETHGCRWIDLQVPPSRWDWLRWYNFLFHAHGHLVPDQFSSTSTSRPTHRQPDPARCDAGRRAVVHVSPPWPTGDHSAAHKFPVRDLLLAACADRWQVIHLRPRGTIVQITQARLDQQGLHSGLTTIVDLTPRRQLDGHTNRSDRPVRPTIRTPMATAPPEGEFLLHWTRSCSGRWPDQTDEGFLDELLGGRIVPRSAVAVLERILTTERLLGTGAAIRGGHAMVCFTELSLHELTGHRTYRSHRQRWDAEPYGLGISRSWLIDRGARPVCYGDDTTWGQLTESDRPYFQLASSPPATARRIDWTAEREWRVTSPLDLSTLPGDAAWVWVPDEPSAMRLGPISRWPVVAIPPEMKRPEEIG